LNSGPSQQGFSQFKQSRTTKRAYENRFIISNGLLKAICYTWTNKKEYWKYKRDLNLYLHILDCLELV